eukprot:c25363_g1_i6 orf=202-510(+)
MALKHPQHYVRKTFEQKDLEMAKSFSDRAFLGISENVSGHHETLVSQFFSGEASTQVKNLFLVGLWPAKGFTLEEHVANQTNYTDTRYHSSRGDFRCGRTMG